MFCPTIGAWVEKSDELSGPCNRPHIATFRTVAGSASVSEVSSLRGTAVLYADDVIDFAAVEGPLLRSGSIRTIALLGRRLSGVVR